MTFTVTLEEFKAGVAEFTKACPELDSDSLENGHKAVGLLYLGVEGIPDDALITQQAVMYLQFAQRRYMDRRMVLDFGCNPLTELKRILGMKTTS